MSDSQLVPHNPTGSALSIPGASTMADAKQILTTALQSGSSPEAMEKILGLYERMKATAAKEAFDSSLAGFQANCPVIVKKKAGAKRAYFYAPLEDIVSQVRRLLQHFGFTYRLTSEASEGWVRAVIRVTHTAGHSEESEFKCPIDGNRANMMTDPQRYGAAMTFAKRYAFTNAFGILTADEDVDARDKREFAVNLGPQSPGPQSLPPRQSAPPPRPAPQAPPPTIQADPVTVETPTDEAKKLRGAVWAFARVLTDKDWNKLFADGNALQQYLWDEGIISDTEQLQTIPVNRLAQVLEALKEKFPQT